MKPGTPNNAQCEGVIAHMCARGCSLGVFNKQPCWWSEDACLFLGPRINQQHAVGQICLQWLLSLSSYCSCFKGDFVFGEKIEAIASAFRCQIIFWDPQCLHVYLEGWITHFPLSLFDLSFHEHHRYLPAENQTFLQLSQCSSRAFLLRHDTRESVSLPNVPRWDPSIPF